MRIGLDATPLLGARTGIGRYTGALLEAPDLPVVGGALAEYAPVGDAEAFAGS